MICRRCLVAGKVQGVFFRAATRQQAQRLGVQGMARNLPDGRVEVLACGRLQVVDALCAWLHAGPPLAEVSAVDCTEVEMSAPDGFRVV
jgi:acylphosphatase